jgi:CTP synthase
VTIAVVGKYTGLLDAYKSLNEALTHGGIAQNSRVSLDWVDSEVFERGEDEVLRRLAGVHGILVPAASASAGRAARSARCASPARSASRSWASASGCRWR